MDRLETTTQCSVRYRDVVCERVLRGERPDQLKVSQKHVRSLYPPVGGDERTCSVSEKKSSMQIRVLFESRESAVDAYDVML
jgi:hypothetical protein